MTKFRDATNDPEIGTRADQGVIAVGAAQPQPRVDQSWSFDLDRRIKAWPFEFSIEASSQARWTADCWCWASFQRPSTAT